MGTTLWGSLGPICKKGQGTEKQLSSLLRLAQMNRGKYWNAKMRFSTYWLLCRLLCLGLDWMPKSKYRLLVVVQKKCPEASDVVQTCWICKCCVWIMLVIKKWRTKKQAYKLVFGFICWSILSWSPINSSLLITQFKLFCFNWDHLSPSKTLCCLGHSCLSYHHKLLNIPRQREAS